MKRIALIISATLFTFPVLADEAPPFAPITIDQATYSKLVEYIASLPWKEAQPLMGLLDHLERDAGARAAKEKADAGAKAKAPHDTVQESK